MTCSTPRTAAALNKPATAAISAKSSADPQLYGCVHYPHPRNYRSYSTGMMFGNLSRRKPGQTRYFVLLSNGILGNNSLASSQHRHDKNFTMLTPSLAMHKGQTRGKPDKARPEPSSVKQSHATKNDSLLLLLPLSLKAISKQCCSGCDAVSSLALVAAASL